MVAGAPSDGKRRGEGSAGPRSAWEGSPGHHANIVGAAHTHVGFGQAANAGSATSTAVVQVYGGGSCPNR
jgi:hypothetical protein